MSRILLTNDDGVDSPALVPLARSLGELGDVTVVVPDRERSWVGKAITRFDPIRISHVEREGIEIVTTSGFPADATQIGAHSLDERLPDLVVSGINLGYNHGVGFLMSSGTVGAAIEGWLAGIPAVALSTGTMTDWAAFRRAAESPHAGSEWERLAAVGADIVEGVTASGVFDHADVVSVNLPFESTMSTPRRVTSVARVRYHRLFTPSGEGYFSHDYGGGFEHVDHVVDNDMDAAYEGLISVVALKLPTAVEVPNPVRRRLEGGAEGPLG